MKFLTRNDLAARGITFSNKHLLELERRGKFPKRIKLGLLRVAWVEEEIDQYQQDLVSARVGDAGYLTRVMRPA